MRESLPYKPERKRPEQAKYFHRLYGWPIRLEHYYDPDPPKPGECWKFVVWNNDIKLFFHTAQTFVGGLDEVDTKIRRLFA